MARMRRHAVDRQGSKRRTGRVHDTVRLMHAQHVSLECGDGLSRHVTDDTVHHQSWSRWLSLAPVQQRLDGPHVGRIVDL